MRKPPTIQDVAGALGMHKSTISQALSGKGNVSASTRARILSAAREMGYEPNPLAQRLANGYRNDLVCLFSGILDTGIATEKTLLIQQALSEYGWEAPIYACAKTARDPARSQADQIRQLCRQRPRAILCAAQFDNPVVFAELEVYRRSGGVVVTYDTPAPVECDQVIFDREENAYRALRHLLELGHRRIGIAMSRVTWRQAGTEGDPQTHRLRGYQRALREFGLSFRDEWLFRNAEYEPGGAEMARQFLQLTERPTAMAVVNDYVAMAFMVEVMRTGVRIPEDLSIIGHDNQPVAALCPVPLTTTDQPTTRIAETVVDMLRERLTDPPPDLAPRRVVIPSQLIVRASTASPREDG